ncbi:murein hydrolase activator EnvC family protein [Kroppenstedtia sanguinis]|uniref:Murein hydrolase activator EnvC family protein n=1 Tax=Kroppenstedtia sanguinis TaxID=1380684 RepID=A0ABW4CBN7_9BACL
MKNNLSTRWIGSGLSLILAATLLIPGGIHAEDIQEKKEDIKERDQEIQRLEKEKAATKKDLKSVLADLDQKKMELADQSSEVYELEQKLKKTKQDLQQKEEQLDRQEQRYKERVRTLYEQGEMFYIEPLLNSENLGEFLNRLKFVQMVVQRDQQLVERYQRDRSGLRQEKQKYEQLLTDRRKKEKEAHKLHAQLIQEYKQVEKDLNGLTDKQEHLEEVNAKESQQVRELVRKQQKVKSKKVTAKASGTYDGGKFLKPVKGARITSGYGMRYHPVRKQYKMHTGVDFGAPLGTPIHAAAAGKVIASRPMNGYGYIVVIDHGGGISTLYAHVYAQDVKVSVGQSVSKGQTIALVGNNGWSTGPHLHLEVLKNGEHTDPMPYLK